jgi:pSer/pThr/pTyr-binding forkhead associated (FHA) protein/S1-C subfamily serine protease
MPYLKLVELATERPIETREAVVRLGRDPGCTVTFAGDDAHVVSGRHAEIRYADPSWLLVDLGSRNGTFLNAVRLTSPAPLSVGDEVGLGETGPKLTVVAIEEAVAPTVPERPGLEVRAHAVALLHAATGRRYEAQGTRIRLGRGRECEIRLEVGADTTVSRVHAEFSLGPGGGLVIRDAGSRNGTYVNGDPVTGALPVRLGDQITLGRGGPVLMVEGLGTAPALPSARRPPGDLRRQTLRGLVGAARARARAEGARGGRRSTAFLRAVVAEVRKDSRRKARWLGALILLLGALVSGGVYGVYWLLSGEVQATAEQQRTAGDSARAEAERLQRELAAASAAAAPEAQVDSLRAQLESAQLRTTELRAALDRAQAALTQQLSAGETDRAAAAGELQRLREELAAAERRAPPPGLLDSLRSAVTAAEQQTAGLDAKLRAIRGTDFASMAQQTQSAVGLITVALEHAYYNGTGFVITPDGYMLTNWHVVADSNAQADTIWVTMADHADAHYADVVSASQLRDVALLKIRSYQGPYLTAIDWAGGRARQGEPAALIGFPAGAGFARTGSRSAAVRTSMSAGIISRVTDDLLQFDGMTIGGSSGSPLFNASGEVISIHRAGLPQGPGFALSVPIKQAIPLLPPTVRQRLGIP